MSLRVLRSDDEHCPIICCLLLLSVWVCRILLATLVVAGMSCHPYIIFFLARVCDGDDTCRCRSLLLWIFYIPIPLLAYGSFKVSRSLFSSSIQHIFNYSSSPSTIINFKRPLLHPSSILPPSPSLLVSQIDSYSHDI